MAAAPDRPDEDCLQAQHDECLSISLIFPEFRLLSATSTSSAADMTSIVDEEEEEEEEANTNKNEGKSSSARACADLTLLSADDLAHPISYSVRLRPTADDDGDNNDHDQLLWPSDRNFALVVTYPPSYPSVAPVFSFSSSALHPIQEEACLTTILTDIRPDLDAGNPCVLTAIASARQFFLDGGLATGLLHSIDEDALSTILTFVATDVQVVEDVVMALPILGAVKKRNEVWKQLCQLRWQTKWGYERRWRLALAEEKEFHKNRHHSDATSTMGTWWYNQYMWQEEDAKRNDMTVEELTDPSIVWDVRNFFERSARDRPEHMRDVLMSGLRRSIDMVQFVRLHRHGADSDHLPKLVPKDEGHSAGLIRGSRSRAASDDDLAASRSWCWCLFNNTNNNPGQRQPQIVSMYSRNLVRTEAGIGTESEVQRLPSWGWEMRNVDRVFRCIDVSVPVSDGAIDDRTWDAKFEEARTRLDGLWSDYLENLVTEEKPTWVKPRKHGTFTLHAFDLPYREIPDDEDLKVFLPW